MSARVRLWWRALTRRRAFEADLEAELAFHLEARRADLVADGMEPTAATRQARIELGMAELHRDAVRRARGLAWVDDLLRDLRFAVRGLVRNPGYAATALGVLGIALAANARRFALFNAYALRNPPLARPERWVAVEGVDPDRDAAARWFATDADALLRDPPPMFEGLYTLREVRLPVVADVTRTAYGEAVSDNYFELLGIAAAQGRTFRNDDAAGDAPGIVLSDVGWRRLLDADPGALGRSITVAGRPHTVLGVAPPEFTGIIPVTALFWIRERDFRTLHPDEVDDSPRLDVGGFLRAGASRTEAALATQARALRWNADKPEDLRITGVRVDARRGHLRPSELRELLLLGSPVAVAFALLLLVAAANLANLVLARFSARQHEFAVRAAVGAPRGRLVAQLVTECALLGVLASALGYALAWAAVEPVHHAVFGMLGELGFDLIDVDVDARVFGYGLALSVLALSAFGALPAWLSTAPWRAGTAAPAAGSTLQRAPRSRVGAALMVTQIATSVLLLVVAGLIAGNARRLEQLEIGFDPGRVVALGVDAPDARLARSLAALPAVEAVGAAAQTPLMGNAWSAVAEVDGNPQNLGLRLVDAGYFDVLGVDLVRGRGLSRGDEAGARVVVISRRTAQRWWPDADPLGRTLDFPPMDDPVLPQGRHEVVGVVEDVASGWFISGVDDSAVYVPAAIGNPEIRSLMVRVRDASQATLESLARVCAEAAPTQNCEPMPLTAAVRMQRVPFLAASVIAAALGWTALAISCIGLYGLVSYLMLRRRREIGVRLALGASAARVAREMVAGAARQIALGVAIGLPLAFALARIVASLTDRLRTFDLVSFVAVPLLLVGLALCASWIPARRGAALAPTEALREE